jgi:hypothetical protein
MRLGGRFELAYILASSAASLQCVLAERISPGRFDMGRSAFDWFWPLVAPIAAPFWALGFGFPPVSAAILEGHPLKAWRELLTITTFITFFILSLRIIRRRLSEQAVCPMSQEPVDFARAQTGHRGMLITASGWFSIVLYLVIAAGILWAIMLTLRWRAVGPAGNF